MEGSDPELPPPARRWPRRVALLLVFLAGAGVAAWAAFLSWANGGGLEAMLERELWKAIGSPVTLDELRVSPTGVARAAGLKVDDPSGSAAVVLLDLVVDWRWPRGGQAPFAVRIGGGRVDWNSLRWRNFTPSTPAERLEPMAPRLSKEGAFEAPPGDLVEVSLEKLEVRADLVELGWKLHVPEVRGEAVYARGPRLVVKSLEGILAPGLPLEVSGVVAGPAAEVRVALARTPLAKVFALPPLGAILARFGMRVEGEGSLQLELRSPGTGAVEASGTAEIREGGLALGPMAPIRRLDGRWTFRTVPTGGLAGPVEVARLEMSTIDVESEIKGARGEMSVTPERFRLRQLRGGTRFGPASLGVDVTWGRGLAASLRAEVGGAPGHWLSHAQVEFGLGTLTVRDAQLRGGDLDLVVEGSLMRTEAAHLEWEVSDGRVRGVDAGTGIDYRDLTGKVYLDAEGNISFDLNGPAGVFQGQFAADGSLQLWMGPSLQARVARRLAAP